MSQLSWLQRRGKLIIWLLVIVVYLLVGAMRSPYKLPFLKHASWVDYLPLSNAIINTIVSLCLIIALIAVKQKNITLHRRFMHYALSFSVLFLLTYTCYHFSRTETSFPADNPWRPYYLIFLFSHIIGAGVSLPCILYTWFYGITNDVKKHRWWAKRTYPIWLYVAITGPLCYLMLYQFYPQSF